MGVAEGCRLIRAVAKDEVLTYDDVEVPPGRLRDELRAEQEAHFAGTLAATGAIGVTRQRVQPAEMPVVILSGGMGTRLREETEHVPKPLLGDRREADPVAHHEDLRAPRLPAIRVVPRLQELADQGVLPPLPRVRVRLHARHERSPRAEIPQRRGERELGGHLRRDRVDDRDRRAAVARARLHRHRDVHVHLRGRHRARQPGRAARLSLRAGPDRHGHRSPSDVSLRRDAASKAAA